jgi:UPF0755 protein
MKFFAFIGRISPFVFAVFVPVFIALVWFNLGFLKPADSGAAEPAFIEIPEGASIEKVAEILLAGNLVRSGFAAKLLLSRAQKKQGSPLVFTSGEYEILPSLPPGQVISRIIQGETIKRNFRIKEGDTYHDIAESIAQAGLFPKEEMIQAMTRRSLLLKLKLNAGIPEGYFLPGEFTFAKPVTPEHVFETMIKKSQEEFEGAFPNVSERLEKLQLDLYELLTLASIIEKEGSNLEVKKIISSVYHNRLALQLPFESDHILAYYLKKPVQNITPGDRDVQGPYNTFLRSGFPATPVCTPGKDSISAALFPVRTEFLYFTKDPKGANNFSHTLEEHRKKLAKKK